MDVMFEYCNEGPFFSRGLFDINFLPAMGNKVMSCRELTDASINDFNFFGLAIYSTPIAKHVAYSPAHEVSQVYNSIAAPQYAYGAISAPAIGSSQQSTIRSAGGTVSHYSKAVDTAFSSVRKTDTRISNNVFTPALATKTIAIQQPAILEQKTIPASVVSHVTFDGIGAHYAW